MHVRELRNIRSGLVSLKSQSLAAVQRDANDVLKQICIWYILLLLSLSCELAMHVDSGARCTVLAMPSVCKEFLLANAAQL